MAISIGNVRLVCTLINNVNVWMYGLLTFVDQQNAVSPEFLVGQRSVKWPVWTFNMACHTSQRLLNRICNICWTTKICSGLALSLGTFFLCPYTLQGGHSLVWPMKVCAAGQRMVLNKIESLVLNWVCILEFFCSKHG